MRIADRDKALRYEVKPDEMLLTVHRWFARKSCPGNWLMERLGSLADGVNGKLAVIVCFRSFQHCFRHRMPSSYFASNVKPPFRLYGEIILSPTFCSQSFLFSKCIFGEHSMIVEDNTKRTESVGSLVGLLPVKLR